MILDFLFGKKNSSDKGPVREQTSPEAAATNAGAAATPKAASGTHIQYNPELVGELKGDHQSLLALYGQVDAAYKAGNLAETSKLLEKFRDLIMAHLLKENVRFYIYLEHSLASDPTSQALVRQFRQEMDKIGKAVMAFLDKYRNIAVDAALAGSFGADLGSIGTVLVQRVRNEEDNLYPLYLPVY